MKKAQIITLLAGLLILISVILPWLDTPNLELVAKGTDLGAGLLAAAIGAITIVFTLVTFVKRNKQALILNNLIAALISLGCVAVSFWYAPTLLNSAGPYVSAGLEVEMNELIMGSTGYYMAMAGGLLLVFAACVAYAARPEYKLGSRVLRVEARWRGKVIKEQVFLEPHSVSIGEDLKSTFVVPDSPVGAKFELFRPEKGHDYTMKLHSGLKGEISVGGKISSVDDFLKEYGQGGGDCPIGVSGHDFGVLYFGELELVFRFVSPEQQIARQPLWSTVDHGVAAALLLSLLVQTSFLAYSIVRDWSLGEPTTRACEMRMELAMCDLKEEQDEIELIDMGEEEDTVGKKAGGEEGKFGDPDEDPNKESIVPKRDGKMVDKVDPKKVGLNDLLSTNKLGGSGAISNIMSANNGMGNKLAVAMSGEGTEFVMGYGSGGLGFRGTGSGGGGSGYGRIHGLGKIDTGGGTGVNASLGRKRNRRVGNFKLGGLKATGFCSKKNLSDVVRRRAGAIRVCYEKRLQIKQGLKGKIVVQWRIGLDGKVEQANVVGGQSSLKDSNVQSCILRTIRRMRFAKPEGGKCVVRWPFVFRAGG